MTIDPPRESPELDEFIGELTCFKHACGSPSNRELAKLSSTVLDAHQARMKVLRPLTSPVLSEVLARKRQNPPPWGWVATYVLTCLHYLEMSGTRLHFAGPTDLQAWHERYTVMRTRFEPTAAGSAFPSAALGPAFAGEAGLADEHDLAGHDLPDVLDSAVTDRAVAGREEAEPLDGPVSTLPPPPPGPPVQGPPSIPEPSTLEAAGQMSEAVDEWLPVISRQQSMAHRRYYALLGPHAVDLLSAAERGDREAASLLGILLLCHDLPHEAKAWLASAAGAGDDAAQILINAAPSQRRQMAAELAYEFTLPGYDQDRADGAHPSGAEIYYRAAAAAGHMGATIRMGLIYEARGETTAALHTYAQAAAHAHPGALDHFARLNLQLAREQAQHRTDGPPPSS
ncbi:hypothetical protein [Actinomadura napierensis]|uniref:Sel1 repeat family protein n=1 Tax=Actinomadura napierensis TaxID=267854 RepID=A0ABN3AHE9_9ACTN